MFICCLQMRQMTYLSSAQVFIYCFYLADLFNQEVLYTPVLRQTISFFFLFYVRSSFENNMGNGEFVCNFIVSCNLIKTFVSLKLTECTCKKGRLRSACAVCAG